MRKTTVISYKRKLRNITDYRKRIKLLAGNMPRLVVRKSLNHVNAQIIEFNPNGDKVIAAAHSTELKKYGWQFHSGNLPAAYLTGLLIGHRATHHKIKKAVLDLGLSHSVPGSSPYALVKGALDAGLEIPHSKEMLPDDSRILGNHIVAYLKHAKGHQFSKHKKEELAEIPKLIEHVKSKILKEIEHGKKGKH